MERYKLSALIKDIEMGGDIDVVIAADAQRALDAEREKVAKLEKIQAIDLKNNNEYRDQLATLQAQLAAMTESRDAWRLAQECSEKAYMSLATQIPSERYDYDPVNLALLDGAKEQERIGRKQIADLQAQLRQVREDIKRVECMIKYIRASLLCQEKQRLALPMPKRTVLEPFGEKASRFTIHYDGGHPGCKVVIESADGALDAIAELLTDEYRKQSSLPAQRAKLAQGGV